MQNNSNDYKGMILPRFAIKRPVTVYMIFIAVIILGMISFSKLSIDLLPDFTFPMSIVITSYEGAGPSEIETMVTRPLERTLSTTKDLKEMNSYSLEGFSAIMLTFEWGSNMDLAANDVREKIDLVKSMLPKDVDNPMIIKFDMSLMPVMMLGLSYKGGNLDRVRYLAEQVIQPRLERITGVASAAPYGGLEREIKVEINRQAMEASGLSIQQVIGAIGASNLNLPAGHLKTGTNDYIIRTVGQFKKVSELENITVGNRGGATISLRNIARVSDSFKEKTSEVKLNGEPAVVMQIQKTPGANTVAVCDSLTKALKEIQKELPEDFKITTVMDSSIYIKKSIKETERSAVEGAFLAIVVILLFLRSVSSTIIVSTAIPISLITAFVLMYFGKMTLNIVTMGGLALGVGRLVDDAIVVIESIFRHRLKTDDPARAAVEGASEVALAVLASTITTVVVFVPILFVGGMAGIMFKPMAYTVVISLAASYFVAMVLIPLLSKKFLRRIPEESKTQGGMRGAVGLWQKLNAGTWLITLDGFYRRVLEWALANRKKVVYVVIACFIITLPVTFFIGSEFIPATDEGEFEMNLKLPVGTKLEKTKEFVKKIENIMKNDVPEAKSVFTNSGVEGKGFMALSGVFGGLTGSHATRVRIELVEKSKRKRSVEQIVEVLRKKFQNIPDLDFSFDISGGMSHMGSFGAGAPINVEIRGYDFNTAQRIAEDVIKEGNSIKGIRDMKINRETGLPEMQVVVNREKASALGLSVAQIAQTIQSNIDGSIASLFRDEQLGKEFYITVRLQEKDREKSPDLGNIFITSPLGKQISLSNVARMVKGIGPIKIDRKNQERILLVTGQTYGVPPGTVAAELENRIKKNVLVPSSFIVSVTGSYKEQVDAFRNLLFALLLAVTLVYMVMASQFESFIDPFIIMFSVPLGIIGVIWGLFLTGNTLSVISFLGIIMMSGIVVSNAILLVDYANTLRKQGMPLEEAVITAGRTRLRPVLMTTLTTIVAMIPLALGLGEGSEMAAPMAVSVVGGLTVSTILTLIFIPTLYTIVESRFRKKRVS